jgi:MATE family multidrug resistance protein
MKNSVSIKNDFYPLIRLAIPLALNGIVQSAVWFFETLFLARLGSEVLAAGSLVSWLFGVIAAILFGILTSINILIAHKHGAKDQEGIALVARDGLFLAVILVVPSFILFWNSASIFLLFGQSATVVDLATSYLHALAWGLLADYLMIACLDVIMGLGHARVILVFSVLAISISILCSYILIFGKFGFPALGIAGAGWGLTASYWISFILLFIYIVTNKVYRNHFRYIFKFHKPSYIWQLIQVGVPMGIMYCVEVGFFFALILLMGLFGTQMQAANQIALQYMGLLMSMMFSIAQAITVRMGHLLGAQQSRAAEKAAYIGIFIAAASSSVMGIFYWTCPDVLISIDFNIHDPHNFALVTDIKNIFFVSAVFQILEATRIAFFGALRGMRDTKVALITSVISFWGIAIPTGYLLAVFLKVGGVGFWWGMVIGACFNVIMLRLRFKSQIKHCHNSAYL